MFGRKKKNVRPDIIEKQEESYKILRKVPEILTCQYSAIGNRKYQQDAVYVSESKKIAANKKTRVMAAVCDGMGGMADGGKASSTAINILKEAFEKIEKAPEVNIPLFFKKGIKNIDEVIHGFPHEDGRGSGTTMVAVMTEGNLLYIASVGDSRIYFLRGNDIKLITKDHNYYLKLMQMVENGEISREQAEQQKQKEALISFLGIGNVSLMDVTEKPIELIPGDMILLCSDGVTKTLSADRIKMILKNDAVTMQEKAEILVEAAVRENTHSQDNTSVALLQYIETNITKER